MKIFCVFTKLVLLFLLVGIATTLLENSFPNSAQELSADTSREDSHFSLQRDSGSIPLYWIHSVLSSCFSAPAFAGDLQGD